MFALLWIWIFLCNRVLKELCVFGMTEILKNQYPCVMIYLVNVIKEIKLGINWVPEVFTKCSSFTQYMAFILIKIYCESELSLSS